MAERISAEEQLDREINIPQYLKQESLGMPGVLAIIRGETYDEALEAKARFQAEYESKGISYGRYIGALAIEKTRNWVEKANNTFRRIGGFAVAEVKYGKHAERDLNTYEINHTIPTPELVVVEPKDHFATPAELARQALDKAYEDFDAAGHKGIEFPPTTATDRAFALAGKLEIPRN